MITLSNSRVFQNELVKPRESTSIFSKLITWAANQEKNRIGWMGIALAVHGCLLTPLTAITVMVTTLNFALFMTAIGAMALSLVTNLAALPTKITIPVFFFTILIDIVIIAVSIASIL